MFHLYHSPKFYYFSFLIYSTSYLSNRSIPIFPCFNASSAVILSPFLKFGIDITRLKKDTAYLQSEIITENTRRGNISEALVWEVTEHNDKVNCYFNNYDLWFGTPMFRHNTERYIINIDGYTVYKQEDDITTEEETVFDTVTEEETTAAE